jgi:hypothetical protein
MRIRPDLAWDLLNNVDASVHQGAQFIGIIREKPHAPYPKIIQDRNRQTEITAVSLEAEYMIRSYGVESAVLKSIGLKFRHQSDTAPFLMLVNQHTASLRGNGSHRQFQLVSAVAAEGSEHVASEALRMDT